MRLTKRQLRRIIREAEGSDIKNIGHLKDALAAAKGKKRDDQGKDALKGLGKGFLADLIPGGGSMSSIYDLLKTTYTMDDDKRTGTALDYLDVDDEVSAIVDDPIENKFLKALAGEIEGMPNEMPLEDFDMTKLLSAYIEDDFGGRTITGFTEAKMIKVAESQLRRFIREEIGRNYHTLDTNPHTWKDYEDVHYEVHPSVEENSWYASVECKSDPSLSTGEHRFADEQSAEHWVRMQSEEIMRATINDVAADDDDDL